MLLSIRAGRSSRPVASFVRLANPWAHHRQESLQIGRLQWRTYATDTAKADDNGSAESGAVSSKSEAFSESKLQILTFLRTCECKV
jgi:DNA polymerase gamma 1